MIQELQNIDIWGNLTTETETIHGIYNKVITRSYTDTGMKGKVFGMSVDGTPNYSCGYDQYGRLNRIATPAGNFDYTRLPNSDLVSQLARPNGVTTTWSYEPHRDLVTRLANGTISTFDYVNNAIGNRTGMARGGSAFTTPDIISYGYDSRGEVTSAQSNQNSNYNYAYSFDPIGNRITSNLAGTAYNYTSNFLNQYTAVNTETPTYDADGNMLTRDGWTQVWNGENRLIETSKDNIRLTFNYDYMGRRIEKKVYDGESLTRHLKFVYDEYKLIEELNGADNAAFHRYTWQPENAGLDVPLSIQDISANTSYFYTTDANKNITGLLNHDGTSAGHYEYSPFGTLQNTTGSYATENPFRFSSEYFDAETEIIYYNYRYYDSCFGRWISRDPIGEIGGSNLYAIGNNGPINEIDLLGLNILKELKKLVNDATKADADNAHKHTAKQIRDALKARGIADEAKKDYEDRTGDNHGWVNGPTDALRHCVWSCEMTKAMGREVAKEFLDAHEAGAPKGSDKPGEEGRQETLKREKETEMDKFNNDVGQDLGEKNCPENCTDRCNKALENGQLTHFGMDSGRGYTIPELIPSRTIPKSTENSPSEGNGK